MQDLIPKETFRTGWEQYWLSFQQSPARVFWNADPTEAAQDVALFKDYLLPALPLVDVGCGDGTHTRALGVQTRFAKIIGTDIAPAAIARARSADGERIGYRVLDLLRPDEAAALHREIGDANVHIRGVLHQLPDAHREAAVISISQILGDSGTLYLKELSPAADLYLQDLLKRFGPVEGLERVLEVLGKAGISWGSFSYADVERSFPQDRFTVLAKGDTRIRTTNRLSSGEMITIPAIYAVLRPERRRQMKSSAESISKSASTELKAHLQGELFCSGDPGYDHARSVWNGAIDKHPALIARCASESDVVTCIRFARDRDLLVAIRAGGHSVAGHSLSENGLVIDVSQTKVLQIDADRRMARAGAGLTAGELLLEMQPHGLAIPTGLFSTVGLAGLTLGGGIGWLTSKYGLTCDNLTSVNIVTADGRILKADDYENPDLFWAVRGGGGNFGVVTAFEFRLHPLGQVLAGMLIYPITRAPELLSFYRDFTSGCADEMTVSAVMTTAPDGSPVAILMPCYCGAHVGAGESLARLRGFGPPVADLIRPQSIAEASTLDRVSPPGRKYHYRAYAFSELQDEALNIMAEYASSRTSPFSSVVLQHFHGAATRVDAAATAFALRREHYILEIIAQWEQGDGTRHVSWVERFSAAIEPLADRGVYVNFLADEPEERVRASYGGNYERLARIKRKYDPDNFFRLNQNIKPASAVA